MSTSSFENINIYLRTHKYSKRRKWSINAIFVIFIFDNERMFICIMYFNVENRNYFNYRHILSIVSG